MEERLARLEEVINRLVERVDGQPRRGYEPRVNLDVHHEREERYEDRGLKVELPDFDGTTGDPEVYLEWEKAMERYFEYKDTPLDRKFKLAKMKLVKSAGVWFEGIQRQRIREDRLRISTWDKLRKHLRRKHVPANYKQTLYIKMSSLKQDRRGVQEYVREFEKLLIDCEWNEPEEMKLGRFVGGLNKDLRDRLEAYPNLGYDEACNLAAVFERQRKSTACTYEVPLREDGPRTTWKRSPTPHPTKTQQVGSSSNPQPKTRELEKGDMKEMVCYRCNGFGHLQRDCPNKRAFTIREWEEIRANTSRRAMLVETEEGGAGLFAEGEDGDFAPYVEEAIDTTHDDSSEEGAYDEQLPPETQIVLMVRKNFLSTQHDQHEQRENLFQTKCRVKDELCDVIIDSGSKQIVWISA